MPPCGPHGVPWLLVAYDMPDHTSKLRLTNLTTGTTTLLLTVGRDSLPEDWPDEEAEDEEDSGSETGGHSAEAGPSSNAAHAAGADHPEPGVEPHPPQPVPKAPDQISDGPLLGHAARGLGLRDKIPEWQFLEDGRHVFLVGRSMDNASEASCWQVLSIPGGQTTALARESGLHDRPHLVGGRWIIAQTPSSLLVFHMATLQLCCTIDLQQVLRLSADADLVPDSLRGSFFLRASKTRMAVEVNSRCSSSGSISTLVLVFEISTGCLHACYILPPQHKVRQMQWIAPEPYPILAIKHCITAPPPRGGRAMSLGSTVIGLDVSMRTCIELTRVQMDPGSFMDNLIWPAPGSSLVLGFQWHAGRQPALRETDWRTGVTVHTHLLEGDAQHIYGECELLTPTIDSVQIACHSVVIHAGAYDTATANLALCTCTWGKGWIGHEIK